MYYFFCKYYCSSCRKRKSKVYSCIFLKTGIIKKLLKNNKKAKNKLSSIESLISQALIDLEIIHEEFKTIADDKEKYE